MPHAHFQLPLSNELVELRALHVGDFEALYEVASDPLIWEQHPNPNRYQRPVFENFLKEPWPHKVLIWCWTKQQGR